MLKQRLIVAVAVVVASALAAGYSPEFLRPLWFGVALLAVVAQALLARKIILQSRIWFPDDFEPPPEGHPPG